jgi:hypothetical protein
MNECSHPRPFGARARSLTFAAALQLFVTARLHAESFLESRYQYYQEDDRRIRVDSNYSLFNLDLKDSLSLDGSYLYSVISGASPSGLPLWWTGASAYSVEMQDERTALSLGLTKATGNHSLKVGYAHSSESDYLSNAYSIQDTISFNQKNTELVVGYSYANDQVVSGNGVWMPKRSHDALVGFNQVLSPDDLLSVNLTVGVRNGFLNDPYKEVLVEQDTPFGPFYSQRPEKRPDSKLEALLFVQWTHYINPLRASVETSYRFGRNDWGSHSNTARVGLYKKFLSDRLIVGPSFRYYRQTAARFYSTVAKGNPEHYSADYRLSAEETFSSGVQVRWYAIKDKLAVDAGYERYVSRGLDRLTPQLAYPSAHSVTLGLHYQF